MRAEDWSAKRAEMVREQIRRRGVKNVRVLEAIARVPRERFVPESLQRRAYTDHALAIGHGQSISQPYIVGVMTEAAEVEPGDRVLDIGTGSGYQAAIFSEMGADVYTMERVPELALEARHRLDAVGYGDVRTREGDGSVGWPEAAPFDAILVAAAAPALSKPLMEQLDPEGGRLVAPIGDRDRQDLVRVVRHGTEYQHDTLIGCRFVPLVGEQGWIE